MQRRIAICHRLFHVGLLTMLAAGLLSTAFDAGGLLLPLVAGAGALLALAARLLHRAICRSARTDGAFPRLNRTQRAA